MLSSFSSRMETLTIANIPDEVLAIILEKLDVVSKVRLRRVNRKWNFLLRTESLFSTVHLVETDLEVFDKYPHERYMREEASDSEDDEDSAQPKVQQLVYYFDIVLGGLAHAGVWKHVKHLVVVGKHDYSTVAPDVPITTDWPEPDESKLCQQIVDIISPMSYSWICYMDGGASFRNLQTLVLRNCVIRFISILQDLKPPLRLTLQKSVIINIDLKWQLAFEFDDFTVDLTDYETTRLTFSTKINQLVDVVDEEKIQELNEVYSALLRGRRRCEIRPQVRSWFNLLFGESSEHFQHCANYNFGALSNFEKYTLLYYAKPRTCYRLLTKSEWKQLKVVAEGLGTPGVAI